MKTRIIISLLTFPFIFLFNSCEKEVVCTETIWYEDADSDGFGNADNSTKSCAQPTGYVADNMDCDDSNASINPNGLACLETAIVGEWYDNFGSSHTITASSWTNHSGALFHLKKIGGNYLIYQNDLGNDFNPGLFSKIVITNLASNSFNYCFSFFNKESIDAIETTDDPTNPNDLDEGCGHYAWSLMTRK